jgi:predicted  nucleic acid-binding Zn-ribbon protein
VSNTPRTDAAELEANIGVTHFDHKDLSAAYHFARQLERQLNAANERIKRLEEELNENGLVLQKIQHERDGSNDRIKRLEEALHRIANTDYRGNRSTESQIAFEALTEAKP